MNSAPLLQADLGADDLADLCRDLSALATIHSAQVEDTWGSRTCRLDEIFAAFEQGNCVRALIRYSFEGRTWFDTLIPQGEAVRLVRIVEDDIAEDDIAEDDDIKDDAPQAGAPESEPPTAPSSSH